MGKAAYYIRANTADTVKKFKILENGCEIALQRTIKEMKTRAAPKIKKSIQNHYGVDTATINKARSKAKTGKAKVKVSGFVVDSISLPYQGELPTLRHFSMNPKRPSKTPYQITATIKDGKTSTFKSAFLQRPDNTYLPFQRTGKDRYPIEVIRSVSVPQMITNEAREEIEENVSELAATRLEHHVKQIINSIK